MRKYITKEITFTKFQISKMEIADGKPVTIELEPEIMIGNITQEKAQKEMVKKHKTQIMVYNLETLSDTYQMSIEDFIKHATIKNSEEPDEIEFDEA